MTISEARFHLDIPAQAYLKYYRGEAKNVLVTTHEGVRVQFSAHLLRPYVTRDGIKGEFCLRYDEHHKLIGLSKVSG